MGEGITSGCDRQDRLRTSRLGGGVRGCGHLHGESQMMKGMGEPTHLAGRTGARGRGSV